MTKKTALVKVGRPTVFTPEVVRKLEEAFCWDCTDEEACAHAGVSTRAFYEHKARDEEFARKIDHAQRVPFMMAKKTVLKAIVEDDGALAMKWLKNRQRDRYHEKVEEVVKQEPIEELIKEVDQSTQYPDQFQTP